MAARFVGRNGRGGGIRTPDPLLPKQMRYQTALRPDLTTPPGQLRARRGPRFVTPPGHMWVG